MCNSHASTGVQYLEPLDDSSDSKTILLMCTEFLNKGDLNIG